MSSVSIFFIYKSHINGSSLSKITPLLLSTFHDSVNLYLYKSKFKNYLSLSD